LFYTDGPISQGALPPSSDVTLQCERHPDNESALSRAVRLREIVNLFMPFIVADDGNVIWSGPELLHECDARKERAPTEASLRRSRGTADRLG
ncbi:MAG: hypothetical protein ACREDP_04730, partial [Bradyrhizobium sp.]